MNKSTVAIFIFAFSMTCAGCILNGSFEIAEPNGSPWFDPPVDWVYRNYAGVHKEFVPIPEPQDNENKPSVDWKIPEPVDGEFFCVLSTGDMGEGSDASITFSTLRQRITMQPGDTLKGSYFFGTCDWVPFSDEGRIRLDAVDPNSDPNVVELVFITVDDIGSFSAMADWEPFTYAYTGQQANEYDLIIEVEDIRDAVYKSYLAVDDFRLCTVSRSEGDINGDCMVNLEDFTLLSHVWLATCSDPNTYVDPNAPCALSDIDGSDFVDCGDLGILTDGWLLIGL